MLAREELEREERRLARLRAELMQLAPRVEHLRNRLLARRVREETVAPPPPPVVPVKAPEIKPAREELSPQRELEQFQAGAVYVAAVIAVILFFFCACMVITGKH